MLEGEKIIAINIEEEMKSKYIDYSMSVIVSRALPDVRDGLKPVHRRILYGMHELGIRSNTSTKKLAKTIWLFLFTKGAFNLSKKLFLLDLSLNFFFIFDKYQKYK